MSRICLLVVLLLATGFSASQAQQDASGSGSVCFVVRTFWGHGEDYGDRSLHDLFDSLKAQTLGRWDAYLVVLDDRPFPDLQKVVSKQGDDRIWIFSEWAKAMYKPKDKGIWSPKYHQHLYQLTDEAVRACPPSTEWVVITNGDNTYDLKFVEEVLSTPDAYDVVALDFYSRYQRPTAPPCTRFAANKDDSMPKCKSNELRFCQVDLAAVAWRWKRLVVEDRRFGTLDKRSDSQAADGMMATAVINAGWKVRFVHNQCLVHHNPNPQLCAVHGGVWDDSVLINPSTFGGRCITKQSAEALLKSTPGLEMVSMNLSYDRNAFGYEHLESLPITCLRTADPATWRNAFTFGRVCAARIDFVDLPHDLPPHPWDSWLPDDLKHVKTEGQMDWSRTMDRTTASEL